MNGDLARDDVTPYWKPIQTERPAGSVKKKPRHKASAKRWGQIRERKCQSCRACGTTDGHIQAHHVVRKGSPYFGQDTENCIIGLCSECHDELHTRNTLRIRKVIRCALTAAEVDYADYRAYTGYVDDRYWRIRPVVEGPPR